MNFKINRLGFLETLQILKSLIDRNNILDVLSGVYLELIDDVLICKTTNLQSFMISKSYVTAYSNGKVMVDISLLVNFSLLNTSSFWYSWILIYLLSNPIYFNLFSIE